MKNEEQPFKQRTRVKLSDLNDNFPDHIWTFWASPTVAVYLALFGPARYQSLKDSGTPMGDEALREAEDAYFDAVSQIVLDTGGTTDLKGRSLDLSTPEKVRQTFASDDVDVELLGGIVTEYTNYLTQRRGSILKKVGELLTATNGSSTSAPSAVTSPT